MDTCENMRLSEDDDEVVHEIDVFISKTLAEKLSLLHYPTKLASSPADCAECLSAKIKPTHQKLELEFALDTHSQSYDKSKGEQIAMSVDGMNSTGDTFFRSSYMDKYVLCGSKAGACPDNYALGYLKSGELHITPFHSVIELRPSFKYMDKIDILSKKNSASENGEDYDNEEAQQISQRFEGPNAERDRQMREKSYEYLQQQINSERWLNLNYHPYGSYKSKQEYDNLICRNLNKSTPHIAVSTQDYIKELVPECLRLSGYKSLKDEETAILENKPISDQIKRLLVNAHVLQFSTILEMLRQDVDISSVERLVQQFAVLVQGCWVVKSELLYPEDSLSPLTGFSGKSLGIARDYVVYLFTLNRRITRREVLAVTYVPDEDLNNIIGQIAIRSDKCWEFKYPYDAEYIESHPSVQQSQDIKWGLIFNKLRKDFNLTSDPRALAQKPGPSLPRPKQKRLSRSSMSEEGEESGTDSSTSVTRDAKLKRTYSPKKRTPQSPTKLTAKSKPYHIATLDVSPTFLETTLTEEVKIELKEHVEQEIRSHFIITLSELKEVVRDSDLSGLCNRSDIVELLEEALTSCGAQKLQNKWPQNTTPEPLYAFTDFGNKLDRYRNILLNLFATTARTRPNFLAKLVEDELSEIISENDSRQIFEDYCIHKSGFYYLKGTISLDS